MRTRLATLLLIPAFAVGLSACGGGGKITIGKPAERTETTTGTVPPEESMGDPGSGTTGDQPTADNPIGDLPIDIPGSLPNGGSYEDCLAVSSAFSAMTAAVTGQTLTGDAKEEIDKARDALPAEVQDDFDVVRDAFAKFETGDVISASEALSTDEYRQAQQNVIDYITKVCGGG